MQHRRPEEGCGDISFSWGAAPETFSSHSRDPTNQKSTTTRSSLLKLQLPLPPTRRPCTRLPDLHPVCKYPFRKGKNSSKCHLRKSFSNLINILESAHQVCECAEEQTHSSDQVPSATFFQLSYSFFVCYPNENSISVFSSISGY